MTQNLSTLIAPRARLASLAGHLVTVVLVALSIGLPGYAQAVNRIAYIPNNSTANITVVDTQTLSVVTTIAVGHSHNYSAVINPDASRNEAYVATWGDNSIYPIDTQTHTLGSPIALGAGASPVGITFSPDGLTAYVMGYGNQTLKVIDVANQTVTSYATTGCQPVTSALVGTKLVIGCNGGTVGFFDTASPAFRSLTIAGSLFNYQIAANSSTGLAYVASYGANKVYLIDIASETVSSTLDTSLAAFSGPNGIAINAAGDKLYVGNGSDNKLFVIHNPATTPNLLATLNTTSSGIAGMALSANKTTIYAVNRGNGNNIDVIDLGTDTVTTTIDTPAGNNPTFLFGDFLGTVTASPVVNYTIGGTLSGLGGGKSVVLQNNGADDITLSADGSFTFNTAIDTGNPYNVTVLTQPAGQTCSVTSGSGTTTANVTSVSVTCADIPNTYSIGGTLSGIGGGKTVVLQNNGGDDLTLSADGDFTFVSAITSGNTFTVTVLTQPASQTCSVTSGSGTALANVTDVAVTCVDDSSPQNGQCGPANNSETSEPPSAPNLCATGSTSTPVLLDDGRYSWSCTGTGGGSTAACYTLAPSGKQNQAALQLKFGRASVLSGRSVRVRVNGGSGTGKVSLRVKASGAAKCILWKWRGLRYMKATGLAGTCTATANKAEDETYNSVSSSPVAINVR